MSMCICSGCDRMIDSDDDPDCFVEVGNMRRLHETKIMCEICRDRYYDSFETDEPQPHSNR